MSNLDLLTGTVDEVTAAIADLSAPELYELKTAEAAGDKRKGVLKAIDARMSELAEATDDAPKAAWQADDYTGSLTIQQANWRTANIKPVTKVATK